MSYLCLSFYMCMILVYWLQCRFRFFCLTQDKLRTHHHHNPGYKHPHNRTPDCTFFWLLQMSYMYHQEYWHNKMTVFLWNLKQRNSRLSVVYWVSRSRTWIFELSERGGVKPKKYTSKNIYLQKPCPCVSSNGDLLGFRAGFPPPIGNYVDFRVGAQAEIPI